MNNGEVHEGQPPAQQATTDHGVGGRGRERMGNRRRQPGRFWGGWTGWDTEGWGDTQYSEPTEQYGRDYTVGVRIDFYGQEDYREGAGAIKRESLRVAGGINVIEARRLELEILEKKLELQRIEKGESSN